MWRNYIQPYIYYWIILKKCHHFAKHRDNLGLTERFELMVCGKEVANAYSQRINRSRPFEDQMRFVQKETMK
jgi:lysyl-tRNA synthetase class 2